MRYSVYILTTIKENETRAGTAVIHKFIPLLNFRYRFKFRID